MEDLFFHGSILNIQLSKGEYSSANFFVLAILQLY